MSEKSVRNALMAPLIASMSFEDALGLMSEITRYHRIPFFALFGNIDGQSVSLADAISQNEECRTVAISGGFEPETLTRLGAAVGQPIGTAREIHGAENVTKITNEILAGRQSRKSNLN